jgi:hypothetical protein
MVAGVALLYRRGYRTMFSIRGIMLQTLSRKRMRRSMRRKRMSKRYIP